MVAAEALEVVRFGTGLHAPGAGGMYISNPSSVGPLGTLACVLRGPFVAAVVGLEEQFGGVSTEDGGLVCSDRDTFDAVDEDTLGGACGEACG